MQMVDALATIWAGVDDTAVPIGKTLLLCDLTGHQQKVTQHKLVFW